MYLYINKYDVDYTIRMYLHYQNKYRGMLSTKQIKKIDAEYLPWIEDSSNRYGDDSIYEKLLGENKISAYPIFVDFHNVGEFVVDIGDMNIRLKSRGKSDHSGVYDVIDCRSGCEHWDNMF